MVQYSQLYSGQEFHDNPDDIATSNAPNPPHGIYRRYLKRLLDILVVVLAAPFVLPLVLVLAAISARDGAGPFCVQDRVDRNGRTFRFWKLRTMVRDGDRRLAEYLASNPVARAEWNETRKLENDPRITPLGKFMRKTALDELPQLWNVLKGDMSLVGPRPLMPEQKALYPGPAYHRVRPGLTGLWRINGRKIRSFVRRSQFDARYAERMSFPTDVLIILMTLRPVLRGSGV